MFFDPFHPFGYLLPQPGPMGFPGFIPSPTPVMPKGMLKQAFQPAQPQDQGGQMPPAGGQGGGGDPFLDLLNALGGAGAAGPMPGEAPPGGGGPDTQAAPPTDQEMAMLDPMSAPPMDMGGPAMQGPRPEAVAQLEAGLAILKEGIKKLEEAFEAVSAQLSGATGGEETSAAKQARIVRAKLYRFLNQF